MARVLKQIEVGTQQTMTLSQCEGSYFTFPSTNEIREFHQRGLRAI